MRHIKVTCIKYVFTSFFKVSRSVVCLKILTILLLIFGLVKLSGAQTKTSSDSIFQFGGNIELTNKGISTIPSFTLGDPAVIFHLSMQKGKFSFDPQFRFSLEGKPWTFLFWFQYQLFKQDKFNARIGFHPAMVFNDYKVDNNNNISDVIRTRRHLAGDFSPSWSLTRHISIGAYYLYSYGVEKDVADHHHYLAFRPSFRNIRLTNQVNFSFTPQVYYLKVDHTDGFFLSGFFSVSRNNFPFRLKAIINKKIDSNVPGSRDFLWNLSAVFTFGSSYKEM